MNATAQAVDAVDAVDAVASLFNPIAARDRIYEIDALQIASANERKTLINALKAEGFQVIGLPGATPEPQDWKRGDYVECIAESSYFRVGEVYRVLRNGLDSSGEVTLRDKDGDSCTRDPAKFKWMRAAD